MTTQQAKKALIARRAELIGSISDIDKQLDAPAPDDAEDASFDRQGDEVLSALSQADAAEIARIDAALDRIEQGEYGVCESCGRDIAEKRLEAQPDAVLCIDCASGNAP